MHLEVSADLIFTTILHDQLHIKEDLNMVNSGPQMVTYLQSLGFLKQNNPGKILGHTLSGIGRQLSSVYHFSVKGTFIGDRRKSHIVDNSLIRDI